MLIVQIVYKLSGVVVLIILFRSLSAGNIGVYFFALSFTESFMVLTSFHLNPVLMRRVAADPAQASVHLSPLLGFRLVSSPIYLLCVTVTAVAFTGTTWRVMAIVALCALLENIFFSFGNLFLALRKAIYTMGISVAVEISCLVLLLLGMWWTPSLEVLRAANLLRSLSLRGTAVFVTGRWLCPLQVSWKVSFYSPYPPRHAAGTGRHVAPRLSRLPNLLRSELSERHGVQALLLTMLLGVWQGANAAGFWWQAVHPRPESRAGVQGKRRPSDHPHVFRT